MVAKFYFANPDVSYYAKWCLSKRFDKHFGTKWFRKQTDTTFQTIPRFETNLHEDFWSFIDNMEVVFKLPVVAHATCINKQNSMKLLKFYGDRSIKYYVKSKRWLPCLGCQRNQECTKCPFKITISKDLYGSDNFVMDMKIYHQTIPIETLEFVDDDEEIMVPRYETLITQQYDPKRQDNCIEDIEELSFDEQVFYEIMERYNLHQYLM